MRRGRTLVVCRPRCLTAIPRPDRRAPRRRARRARQPPFGVYVHVPFCATRCGYCDFNTYTATELGGGASQTAYAETVLARDARWPRRVLGDRDVPVETVFFGGGTPTLLPAGRPGRASCSAIREDFGLAADAEITTEANPESVDAAYLAAAARPAGSPGSPSACSQRRPHVLAVLDRQHTPGRPRQAWPRRVRPGSSTSTST